MPECNFQGMGFLDATTEVHVTAVSAMQHSHIRRRGFGIYGLSAEVLVGRGGRHCRAQVAAVSAKQHLLTQRRVLGYRVSALRCWWAAAAGTAARR